MAVEVIRHPEIAEKGQEFDLAPLEQFTPQNTLELLKMYWNNRHSLGLDKGSKSPTNIVQLLPDPEISRVQGVLEIQENILKMLGQGKLMGDKPPKEMFVQNFGQGGFIMADRRVSYINKLDKDQVKGLLEMYQEERRSFLFRGLDRTDPSTFTAEQAKNWGKMIALESTLEHLGQRKIIQQVVILSPERIDWAKNRSTGYGELQ